MYAHGMKSCLNSQILLFLCIQCFISFWVRYSKTSMDHALSDNEAVRTAGAASPVQCHSPVFSAVPGIHHLSVKAPFRHVFGVDSWQCPSKRGSVCRPSPVAAGPCTKLVDQRADDLEVLDQRIKSQSWSDSTQGPVAIDSK